MSAKTCAWVEKNLAAYLHGGLSDAEQRLFQQHVQACLACASRLQAFQTLHTRLAAGAAVPANVLSLPDRQRILNQVSQKLGTQTMTQGTLKLARATFSLLSLAAAIVLIAWVVGWIIRLRPMPANQPTLTPLSTGQPVVVPEPGSTPTPGGPAQIVFAAPAEQVAEFRLLAETFHARYPDVSVQVISAEQLVANDDENAMQRLAHGADAAVAWINPQAAAQGLLYDLAPLIDSSPDFSEEDFFPGTLEAFRWNGGVWALPQGINVNLLLFDRDQLEQARPALQQAGIAYPEQIDAWDRDTFLRAVQVLTVRSGGVTQRYGFVDKNAAFSQGVLDAALRPALSQGRLDTPEVAAALSWFDTPGLTQWISPTLPIEESGFEQARTLVEKNQAAMWSDSLYNYRYYTQQGRKLGMMLLPVGAQSVAQAYTSGYFISAGTSHPAQAWLWLSFLSRQRLQNGLPDASLALPPRRSTAEQSGYWDQFDEYTRGVVQAAAEHLSFGDFDPAWPELYLWAALKAARGGQTMELALADAQASYARAQGQFTQAASLPVQITPQGPRPGAVQIRFFNNSGINDGLFYRLIESFEQQHPDIQVEVLDYNQFDLEDVDCFSSFPSIRDVYDLQPLLDADPALKAQFFPSMLRFFQDSAPQPGTLTSLPWQTTPLLIHYNKALFDAAGLAYPSLEWTMDDFRTAALALTRDTPQGQQYGYIPQPDKGDDLVAFAAAQGAPLWDANGQPRFDQPEVAAVVQWYTNLALQDQVMPLLGDASEPQSLEARSALVNSGRAAMWAEYYPYTEAVDLPAGQMDWAAWPGGVQRAAVFFYDGFSITASSTQSPACWQWITFLTGSPETILGFPARQDVQSSPLYLSSETGLPHTAQELTLQRYVSENYIDAYAYHHVDMQVRPILDALLVDIYGGMPLAQALARAQQTALQGTPTPAPALMP